MTPSAQRWREVVRQHAERRMPPQPPDDDLPGWDSWTAAAAVDSLLGGLLSGGSCTQEDVRQAREDLATALLAAPDTEVGRFAAHLARVLDEVEAALIGGRNDLKLRSHELHLR